MEIRKGRDMFDRNDAVGEMYCTAWTLAEATVMLYDGSDEEADRRGVALWQSFMESIESQYGNYLADKEEEDGEE